MLLFDFGCPSCGHKFEALARSQDHTTECRECGKPADRLVSAVRCKLEGVSGDFPGAALAWDKRHTGRGLQKQLEIERKRET